MLPLFLSVCLLPVGSGDLIFLKQLVSGELL